MQSFSSMLKRTKESQQKQNNDCQLQRYVTLGVLSAGASERQHVAPPVVVHFN